MIASFKKKQKTSQLNRFLLIAGGVLILFFCVLLAVASVRVYKKKQQLNSHVEDLKSQVENMKRQNENLKQGISNANDDKYIEKVAREELDLQKPGEKVISFVTAEAEAAKSKSEQKSILQVWLGWLGKIFTRD